MGGKRRPELADPDWLRERYERRRMTYDQIAQELGCHLSAVQRAVKRHGIDSRTRGWACDRPATMVSARREFGDAFRQRSAMAPTNLGLGSLLAARVRAVADAQRSADDDGLRLALIDLAVLSLTGAEQLDRNPTKGDA